MDTARDLARDDPWQQSLERSLARRRASGRAATATAAEKKRADRGAGPGGMWMSVLSSLDVWRERAIAAASAGPTLGPRSVLALTLLAAIIAGALAGGGPQGSLTPARAAAARVAAGPSRSDPALRVPVTAQRRCPMAVAPQGYVNPLAAATVKPERIDQGVDYAGSGTLVAIGAARVTYVATSNTGWPGAFVEYQLLDGADAGCYVFYAEGVTPLDGVRVGQTVPAGQPIATIVRDWPTGIEIGWGAGISTKAYAKLAGQWSGIDDEDNVASPAGKSFSALIASLGGPPGRVEG